MKRLLDSVSASWMFFPTVSIPLSIHCQDNLTAPEHLATEADTGLAQDTGTAPAKDTSGDALKEEVPPLVWGGEVPASALHEAHWPPGL